MSKQINITGLTDSSGNPLIELSGGYRTQAIVCLQFARIVGDSGNTNQSEISGLIINRFKGDAIDIFNDGLVALGNYRIGTNAAGTSTTGFGNGGDGINVESNGFVAIGTFNPRAMDVISGNARGVAVVAGASDVFIDHTFIGTDITGTKALGNKGDGIVVAEGAKNVSIGNGSAFPFFATNGNLISGNGHNGITVGTSVDDKTDSVSIDGNRIGTDFSGTKALGNKNGGVVVLGCTRVDVGQPNVEPAIAIHKGKGVIVRVSGGGNIISGTTNGPGVSILGGAGFHKVQNNLIGTDLTGKKDLGNHGAGVFISARSVTVGGTSSTVRNVISGNDFDGVVIDEGAFLTQGNVVKGNFIGTDISGTQALGNSGDGVLIAQSATFNTIGGTEKGAGNIIAFNKLNGEDGHGVNILGHLGIGNAVLANNIFSNARLGINLGDDNTVTPNDKGDPDPPSPDTGPNGLQNFPVLVSAINTSAGTTVKGTLNSKANKTYRVEIFSSAAADPSGFGEGQKFRAFVSVKTDASGNASFTKTFPVVPAGQVITATATDPQNNTSEFSKAIKVTGSISGLVFNDANGDGKLQSTEHGLPNWKIFIDKNNNGVLDTGEKSVLTDASGKYSLTALNAGTYIIRIVQQKGFRRTAPSSGFYSVTLSGNAIATGKNFGEKKIA
jgi:uncharacterized protein (DUF2141 family)